MIATHLRADAKDVREVDWSVPTAVVLGNEREGGLLALMVRSEPAPGPALSIGLHGRTP